MNCKHMLLCLHLGELELKRLEPLGRWVEQWDYELRRSIETLDPEVWVVRGHDHDGVEENIDGI